MDEDYDIVCLGTGLTECVLSGLFSVSGKKVLHMDRNDYYGGESASLNLEQLFKKFRGPDAKVPEEFGRARDYNVDLCPKFLMSCGNLVKILLHTKVTRYLDFQVVAGSFVYKDSGIHKVPSTAQEALSSSLMGFFQKRKFKNFLQYVQDLEVGKPDTYKKFDIENSTAGELFKWWALDEHTVTFTGHAMALQTNDDYLDQPCTDMAERVRLYAMSVSRYGRSPYIYPLYGLGGLPESFSRLSAVHGGTYMLNKPIDKIEYNEDGTVAGVTSGGETVRCKKLLADPTYFIGTDKVRLAGQVSTSICILRHPIDNTNGAESAQIIIPNKNIPNRKHDLYVAMTSFHHHTAANGFYIATVSGTVEEGSDPHDQLIPALRLLGKIEAEFHFTRDVYEPTDDGSKDNIFISHSYDAQSHFQRMTADVMSLFQRVTGEECDLSARPEELDDEPQ